MASYRHLKKIDPFSYIGSAEGVEYAAKGRRGNWRVTLRSNTALGVGTAAPESFYADTLQEVDARLGEIALKIAAHRAKARKARHRVDVYEGGDEPVVSYPFKDEATAQRNFDHASRRAYEGVEMRLFLNGKEAERYMVPEKKRRSSRRSNSGVPDGALALDLLLEIVAASNLCTIAVKSGKKHIKILPEGHRWSQPNVAAAAMLDWTADSPHGGIYSGTVTACLSVFADGEVILDFYDSMNLSAIGKPDLARLRESIDFADENDVDRAVEVLAYDLGTEIGTLARRAEENDDEDNY